MDKKSNASHRKKHNTRDGSETPQITPRTRQKRGTTSQTPISSLVDYSEESNQCNGLSTSINQTQKSHSASVLSSNEQIASGGQRRSARLSKMEFQQSVQTSDKKKKKSDEKKASAKEKKKGKLDHTIEEEVNEKYTTYKRTVGKSKKNILSEISTKSDKGEDGETEEPVEKRARRATRQSILKETAGPENSSQEEKLVGSNEDTDKNVKSAVTQKSSKKRASKRQILSEPSSPTSDHQTAEKKHDELKQDTEKQEKTSKSSKRKKSTASSISSISENNSISEGSVKQNIEDDAKFSKESKAEERIYGDFQNKNGDALHDNSGYIKISKSSDHVISAEECMQNTPKVEGDFIPSADIPHSEMQNSVFKPVTPLSASKGEKVRKESFSFKSNSISSSKDDLVQEYNRSISEKISLLKPKAFVGRSSASLRKTIDHCDGSGQEVDSDAESRRAIMESAQRRIEQNLSTSESDSRLFRGMHTPVAHSSKNDTSESDSAPDTLSFANGRQDAIDIIKSAAEHVKREKQRLKERRKARLEMLKQQKEEKLIRLKEKMASQEDASCSSSEESGYEEEIRNARQKLKKKKSKNKTQRPEKENLDETAEHITPKAVSGAASDDSSEQDGVAHKEAASINSLKRVQKEIFQSAVDAVSAKMQKVGSSSSNKSQPDDKLKKKSKSGKTIEPEKKDRGFKNLTSLDYIPLSTEGATKFVVVPLDKAMRAPKSLAEEAADFRQNMLYGSRIKRESGKIVSAYQQKLIASGKNFHVR